jgi:hypothetical protein
LTAAVTYVSLNAAPSISRTLFHCDATKLHSAY